MNRGEPIAAALAMTSAAVKVWNAEVRQVRLSCLRSNESVHQPEADEGHHPREDDEFAFSIIATAAAHAQATVDNLIRLKAMSRVRRVGDLLLRLSRANGDSVRYMLPYEKTVLAHIIGLRPESFSRALAHLAAASPSRETAFDSLAMRG